MDGIEPELVARAHTALTSIPGVLSVPRFQLRWVGHRLQGAAAIRVADTSLSNAECIAHEAEHQVGRIRPLWTIDGYSRSDCCVCVQRLREVSRR